VITRLVPGSRSPATAAVSSSFFLSLMQIIQRAGSNLRRDPIAGERFRLGPAPDSVHEFRCSFWGTLLPDRLNRKIIGPDFRSNLGRIWVLASSADRGFCFRARLCVAAWILSWRSYGSVCRGLWPCERSTGSLREKAESNFDGCPGKPSAAEYVHCVRYLRWLNGFSRCRLAKYGKRQFQASSGYGASGAVVSAHQSIAAPVSWS